MRSPIVGQADGYEVYIDDGIESFQRNILDVIVGQRIPSGLLIRRVEPASVTRENDKTWVSWQVTERVIAPSGPAVRSDYLEDDPVTLRIHRPQARAIGLALLAWADGKPPTAEAEAVRADLATERANEARADLDVERGRVDKMLDVVLRIAEGEPSIEMVTR